MKKEELSHFFLRLLQKILSDDVTDLLCFLRHSRVFFNIYALGLIEDGTYDTNLIP